MCILYQFSRVCNTLPYGVPSWGDASTRAMLRAALIVDVLAVNIIFGDKDMIVVKYIGVSLC